MFRSQIFLSILALSMRVTAHGYVDQATIGGQVFSGYLPYTDPYMNPVPARIGRAIPGNGPVEDVTLLDIQCNGESGSGTKPASLAASAAAGDQISFHWTDWPSSHVGPVITYMGQVPSTTNITEDSPTGSDVIWFKIDEAGYEDGKWAATEILSSQNSTWTVTIPSALKAGQYLIRHEIIALHEAGSYPGAQFYPDCFQVAVTGSGTETPVSEALISFPGGYTPNTPGIVFNVYTDITSYPIPGPSVWTSNEEFSSGGSSSTAVDTSTAAASSSVASTTSARPTSAAVSSSTVVASSSAAVASSTIVTTSATASSSAAVSSSSTDATTTGAATPSASTITDANVCMNNYNECIVASQPNPDWTGCGATKDECLSQATYQRLARLGSVGRRLL
ncbi:lytic polysaccharide monooxygenase [Neolentinus lepideus HHB14362 ss-1]|uniref:lytic cellulose monooxygenase (C4-dehydrogenating) n=1 Tax=Neolentinus lepideus HHB14362 ss-1 TaxID=1314782 RepID=A0A165VQH9_9AGAM|nr:lytic polysaccharide monooxygenase [Neolentinus lepideus HHB14362 ss-1]